MSEELQVVKVSFKELRELHNLRDRFKEDILELEERYKKGTYKTAENTYNYSTELHFITQDEAINFLQKDKKDRDKEIERLKDVENLLKENIGKLKCESQLPLLKGKGL